MKKFFVFFCCFASMVLMISCGDSSSSDNNSVSNFGKLGSECYPDKTCDAWLSCDEESNICVEDSDISSENGNETDTTSENDNDSEQTDSNDDPTTDPAQGNDTDTVSEPNDADSGDTAPDSDDGDTTNENSGNLLECSSTSGTPCRDSSSGLSWSARASSKMIWQNAVDYCSSYSEGGLSGWHLPTISELRTLIKNCDGTVTGGSCGVTDSCLSDSCGIGSCYCSSMENNGGYYSKLGDDDTIALWSSSIVDIPVYDIAWIVYFKSGYVFYNSKTISFNVRCVR